MSEIAVLFAVAAVLVLVRFTLSPDTVSYRLTFPRAVDAAQLTAAVRSVQGLLPPWWRRPTSRPCVAIQAVATAQGIDHFLIAPAGSSAYLLGAFRAAIPGLRIDRAGLSAARPRLARALHRRGAGDLRTDQAAATNAATLAALHPLTDDEQIVVQYALSPVGRGIESVLSDFFPELRQEPGASSRRPSEPELLAAVRVGVKAAAGGRRGQLLARVLSSFHGLGTEKARLSRRLLPSAWVSRLVARGAAPGLVDGTLRADELAAGLAIPLDGPQLPGLILTGARELAPDARIPRDGLVLGRASGIGAARSVAIDWRELRRSLHVCAPTGAGKSTVLLNLIIQLMDRGEAVVVIESKGDLIRDVADRVPAVRRRDVIVFDPADRTRPVGFNLLGGADDSDLIVDHVVGQLRARYGALGLGPRSEDMLRSALLTLATEPGRYTLCEVEPLLTNSSFRQRLVGKLDEPVLEGFWAWFNALSEPARAEAVAPLANKLRTYSLRGRVRAVIGQPRGLNLASVLSERKVLLVSLAKGLVGEDVAALIGAAMVSRLWTAIMARASQPEASRLPATVVLDEFQDFAQLNTSFGDFVAQSRGYATGWVLSHQNLAQLDTRTRSAVLANCRSRLVMQTTADDAATFGREFSPHLRADDLKALGPYEAYASVSVGAAVAPPVSLVTAPPPPSLGTAPPVLDESRRRYGADPSAVDAAIRTRILGDRGPAPVGGRRRAR